MFKRIQARLYLKKKKKDTAKDTRYQNTIQSPKYTEEKVF